MRNYFYKNIVYHEVLNELISFQEFTLYLTYSVQQNILYIISIYKLNGGIYMDSANYCILLR